MAIAGKWPDAQVVSTDALKGDASSRRFWRIAMKRPARRSVFLRRARFRHTAIAVDLGPDDMPRYAKALGLYPERMPEPPWINVHRFLTSFGAPVPELYAWSADARALLVEDVGSISLHDAARRPGSDAADLYREAVRELLRLHLEGTRKLRTSQCVAASVAYDERVFAWEMEEFLEFALAEVSPTSDSHTIRRELLELARLLGRLARVFSHRDFHGHNLFVTHEGGGRIRIIDFQDALMAPAAQDLSVLLTTRDTGEFITPRIESRLLDFYYASLIRSGDPGMTIDEFVASYRLCVLQHALKVMGRFVYLERSGKTGYARYVPHALEQARRMLAVNGDDFPALRKALVR